MLLYVYLCLFPPEQRYAEEVEVVGREEERGKQTTKVELLRITHLHRALSNAQEMNDRVPNSNLTYQGSFFTITICTIDPCIEAILDEGSMAMSTQKLRCVMAVSLA